MFCQPITRDSLVDFDDLLQFIPASATLPSELETTIFYVTATRQCSRLAVFLQASLPDSLGRAKFEVVRPLHATYSAGYKTKVMKDFKSGKVRWLVVAADMPVDIKGPRVDRIVQWGEPKSLVDLVQKWTRGALEGRPGTVIAFLPEHMFRPLGDQNVIATKVDRWWEEEVPWEEEGIALLHETDPALDDFVRSNCCYHYFLTWYLVTGHGPPRTPHPDDLDRKTTTPPAWYDIPLPSISEPSPSTTTLSLLLSPEPSLAIPAPLPPYYLPYTSPLPFAHGKTGALSDLQKGVLAKALKMFKNTECECGVCDPTGLATYFSKYARPLSNSYPKLEASQIRPEERTGLSNQLLDWRDTQRAKENPDTWDNTQAFLPDITLERILNDSHLLGSLEFFRARYKTWCFYDKSHPAEIFNIIDVWRGAVVERNEEKLEIGPGGSLSVDNKQLISPPKLERSQIFPKEHLDLTEQLQHWRSAQLAKQPKGTWDTTQLFLPNTILERILNDSHLLVSLEFFLNRYNTWTFYDNSHPAEIFNIIDVWHCAVIERNAERVEIAPGSVEAEDLEGGKY